MRFFPAEDVDAALDFPSLIEALSQAMSGGFVAPRPITMKSSARAKHRRRSC
jgi:hypothetical protein